jgi:hypothetical protein
MAIFNQIKIDVYLAELSKNKTIFSKMITNRPIRMIDNDPYNLGVTYSNNVYPLRTKVNSAQKKVYCFINLDDDFYDKESCPLYPFSLLSTENLDTFTLVSRLQSRDNNTIFFSYNGHENFQTNYPIIYGENLKEKLENGIKYSLEKENISFKIRKGYVELNPTVNLPLMPSLIIDNLLRTEIKHEYKETFVIEHVFSILNHCSNLVVQNQFSRLYLSRLILSYLELKNQGNAFSYQSLYEYFIQPKYNKLKIL